MPGEDQERLENYLELEHYIAELQAGHVTHSWTVLTPRQARIYHMVALLRSASPGVAEPHPEFMTSLWAHLEQELQQSPRTSLFLSLRKETLKQARHISRCTLLTSADVAASLAIGAGVEWIVEQMENQQVPGGADNRAHAAYLPLQERIGTPWHFVTTLALLGNEALRFTTDTIVGYVLRDDSGATPEKGNIIALSAACTHMGCLVQWHSADRTFHCPCHDGLFY